MSSDIEKDISYYTNKIGKEIIGGTTEKRFVRINDNKPGFDKKLESGHYQSEKKVKDSAMFGELFRALKGKECHYVTYLDDLVVGQKPKDVYLPKYVSCLMKQDRGYGYKEILGSRLANAMGIDTVFNIPHEREFEEYEEDDGYPKYDYIISVDCVKPGETIENLASFGIPFREDWPLSQILRMVDIVVPNVSNAVFNLNITQENMQKFKEDIARMYLFRSVLCEDWDFEGKNIPIIIDENGNFKVGPCLDMEFFFYGVRSSVYYREVMEETFKCCQEHFPHVLDDFIKMLDKNLKSGKIQDIMNNSIQIDPSDKRNASALVIRNGGRMVEYYKMLAAQQTDELEPCE